MIGGVAVSPEAAMTIPGVSMTLENGVITQNVGVIDPFSKGHGDSRLSMILHDLAKSSTQRAWRRATPSRSVTTKSLDNQMLDYSTNCH